MTAYQAGQGGQLVAMVVTEAPQPGSLTARWGQFRRLVCSNLKSATADDCRLRARLHFTALSSLLVGQLKALSGLSRTIRNLVRCGSGARLCAHGGVRGWQLRAVRAGSQGLFRAVSLLVSPA